MAGRTDSEEIYDFRDDPPAKGIDDQEFSVLEVIEEDEEIQILESVDEPEVYTWALFSDLSDDDRCRSPEDNENLAIHMQKVANSSIPTCFLDLDLQIIGFNAIFETRMKFITDLPHRHIPELFRCDKEERLGQMLKRSLEDEDSSFTWHGRLFPIGRNEHSTFLKAMIQPCLCEEYRTPKTYILQLDVITKEYNELLQKTFLSLLEASKLKDNDTGEHIGRVNEYSQLLSRHLLGRKGYEEISEEFIDDIGFLAAMHDVGKIGTPDDILNKSGPLDDWEREIMNEHTKNGAYILSTYPKSMARDIALSHHEKWDGSGYPYGIFEEMIPLCARIVCIADVYDALRSERCYKEAFSHEKSVDIMKKGRGKHFDPALLDLFLELNKEFDSIFLTNK